MMFAPTLHLTFYAGKQGGLERIFLSTSKKFGYTLRSSHSAGNLDLLIRGWLKNYLRGIHLPFPLPLNLSLFPPFSKKTLQTIQNLPFGKTATYRDIAKGAGSPLACRAVGNICHSNPYPLIIACHRVIKSNGDIGKFAFDLSLKKELLAFENRKTLFQISRK
jgi:O-6-methylguanine DNA methyltransferase